MTYAVVADGCSSGGKTDVGARLIAHATRRSLIEESWQAHVLVDSGHADAVRLRQEFYIDTSRHLLGLARHDMLATCILAVVTERGSYVRFYGDGVVAYREDDGTFHVLEVVWENNMPYYLGYGSELLPSFIEAHGGDLNAERACIHTHRADATPVQYTLNAGVRGVHVALPPSLAMLAVFSDGVAQIQGVPCTEAVQELLAYKTTAPGFVKRRVKRALTDYARDGHKAFDDVACAAALRTDDEETNDASSTG
jgi:hypothetical protein